VQTDPQLGEILMRAFILRRIELIASGIGDVVLIGSVHSPGTLRIREFLTRNGIPTTTSTSTATATWRRCWTGST
jgi:thioredoxin reductase (NADPH)